MIAAMPRIRLTLFAAAAAHGMFPSCCGTAPTTESVADAGSMATPSKPGGSVAIDLPAHAEAAAELVPLRFLQGTWLTVNPNKTVNEEHWLAPRGTCMLGTFRQVRLDGLPAFVEISQITLEEGQLRLRLRHMHRKLEVPEKRKNANLFELVSISDRRVEFRGTGDAEGVTSVVYERTGPDELTQTIGFAPDSPEKPFVSVYRRAR